MTMQRERTVGRTGDLAPAAVLFHSLSDPTRLTILQHLTTGEHRVRDLTEHLGLAQSTVSAHLACLNDCGLVTSRPVGRASLYSLTTEPELLAALSAAERLLEATGYAVELCPTVSGSRAATEASA
ncbi:ArsR/SmtB family transcription factor [Arthrobacter sulfonylureivorans]|uniref:Metalloregulator ArsR/SmtB family transcription factor n=1 Tax=Arthrobacter sulfonylureivorans TaxID=2486855 RepID=A0ABY3W7F6_9MICC|nr:metalloregulator ArsR/SmtB family transcription factor [Arthrobacter sulfonylureivorans]UNK45170.1 metalloregulator ArsR/SmtB family transcription factor [Arthrobacter sulfonylureivorans]